MSKRWTNSSLLASASKCTWPLAYNSNTFTEGALERGRPPWQDGKRPRLNSFGSPWTGRGLDAARHETHTLRDLALVAAHVGCGRRGPRASAAGLANLQTWGSAITLGTLNVSAIILAGLIGYSLAKNERFDNPLACVVVAISAFVIMMPQQITATLAATSPLLTDKITSAEVTGALSTANTGTNGLFAAIIIALLSVTLFIKISGVEKLKVKLGEGVPPAVSNSFNVMIPMLLNLSIFAIAAALLAVFAGTDLCTIISTCISNPLKSIMNAGPWAVILIYTLANLLFCVGIHQSTISGATVEPILTMLIVDNMATFAAGGTIQPDHYMNMQIVNSFALIGGSGCTLMLLLDTFLFSKNKASKTVAKMAIIPGLFNINEPVIYGYPVVYNLPLMIPFVLLPDLFIGVTYGLTCAGIISPCIAQVPWTMPPVINALLATGFDWRAGVWQALELVIGMAVYLPFMRISEKAIAKQEALAEQNA